MLKKVANSRKSDEKEIKSWLSAIVSKFRTIYDKCLGTSDTFPHPEKISEVSKEVSKKSYTK